MTKRLTDKEKAKRSYIRKWKKASPTGLGPYNIIWESKDPRGTPHVRIDPKIREIRIPEEYTKDKEDIPGKQYGHDAGEILGHEISHTRLLRSFPQDQWPEGITQQDIDEGYESQMYVWREVDAVLYQLAKGQDLERWMLLSQLHDGSSYFYDGSLQGGKKIGKEMLGRLVKRGHITREQSEKAMKEINAIELPEWNEHQGTVQYSTDFDSSVGKGRHPVKHFEDYYGRNI